MRESKVERLVCKYAKTVGWIPRKQIGVRGALDKMFLGKNAQAVFVEFKGENGKLSVLQEKEIKLLKSMGFTVAVIDNVEEGKEFFDSI